MKRKIKFVLAMAAVLLPSYIYCNIGTVSNVVMTPPSPAAAGSVQVTWDFTVTADYSTPKAAIFVSDSPTLRNANTSGQWLIMDQNWPTIPSPLSQVSNGYSVLGGNIMTGSYSVGPYTFNLPADLVPGVTYYIIIAMGNNYFGVYNDHLDSVQATNYFASFTVPLPAPAATLLKTAEKSIVQPGDLVLFSINYTYVNATNFIITDTVPSDCTLVGYSTGGVVSGSTITWNTSSIPGSLKSGLVWFTATVNSSVPPSTTIHNTAQWTMDEIPAGGSSNDATVTTAGPFALVKSQSLVSPAVISDVITYTLDFNISGLSFTSFDPFDTGSAGFTPVSNGGPGWPGTWTYTSDGAGGGYILSPQQGEGPTYPHYPHLLRDAPADFCFGEIEADILIQNGTTNWDGMISFRDNGVPDAVVSYGVGISQDTNPGHLYLQKSVPVYTTLTATNPIGIDFDKWYTVKINVLEIVNGVRIQAKVWLRGTTEPASWSIDYSDTTGVIPACGKVGFQGCPFNPDKYDNLKIFKTRKTNPRVFDTIPSQIAYVGGTAADSTHAAAFYDGTMVSWKINSPLVDTVYQLQWWGNITGCLDIFNTASFDSDEIPPQVDSNTTTLNVPVCPESPTISVTSTESATYTMTLTPTPSFTATATFTQTVTMTQVYYPTLVLTKICDTSLAVPGDTVNYTINYINNSSLIAASNVNIYDILSSKLSFVSADNGGAHSGTTPGGRIDWTIASIAPGASGSVSFSAVVSTNVIKGEQIENQAQVVCTPMQTPVLSNIHRLNLNIPDLVLLPVVSAPNPATGSEVEIIFSLTVAADVTMKFYTISGELIRVMDAAAVSSNLLHVAPGSSPKAGNNSMKWDLQNKSGKIVSSGVYFYRVDAVSAAGEKAFYTSKLAVLR